MQKVTQAPDREELVSRVSGLAPLLRKHARWSEENRRLHSEVIEAMADAGLFKMRTPARYGGYESDARTLVDVGAELALGDASAAWTASVWWIPTWMAGLFPDHVQDEVFSTPDVRVCGTLSPSAAATPVEGGIVVNGQWGFISGAWHSHWQEIIAMSATPDGEPEPVMALVPMSDLKIVDDWDTYGLQGSGSVTTVAQDLFVPEERVLSLVSVLRGQYASERNADSPMFRAPLLGVANASSVGQIVGLAKAARSMFMERLPQRKITYTSYESQGEAPVTHLQLAEATLKIDQAEFHAHRVADLVDVKGVTGEPWTFEERARTRADVGAACELGEQVTNLLSGASGGSSAYRSLPIQAVARDLRTINLHALMYPPTNFELYGRVLCGLEPNTLYI